MQKQKYSLRILVIIAALCLPFLIPKTYAINTDDYKCAFDAYTATELDQCCYGESDEPYNGMFCRGNGEMWVQEGGGCVNLADLQALADDAQARSLNGFNCFTRTMINEPCNPDTYCYDTITRDCHAWPAGATDVNDCAGKGRVLNCNLSCGGCETGGEIICGGACQDPVDYNCSSPGQQFDTCTGECGGCPDGRTKSGRVADCITYYKRFEEIFEDGLAMLGGHNEDGVYDYTETALVRYDEAVANYMNNIFLKSDVAETLNWGSDTLPPVITNLFTDTYFFCDVGNDCPDVVNMVCAEGGFCYTPTENGGGPGGTCTNDSGCSLGLVCDLNTGHCVDPFDSECIENTDCDSGQNCINGECHTAAPTPDCMSNAECPSGNYCNYETPRSCEDLNILIPEAGGIVIWAGFTSYKFNSAGALGTAYIDANLECNSDYGGSHVCTVNEILSLYNQDAEMPDLGQGWINGGPPGYTAQANDCGGWSSLAGFGRYWNFGTNTGALLKCNSTGDFMMGFACCK